jgi:hypothetical protein
LPASASSALPADSLVKTLAPLAPVLALQGRAVGYGRSLRGSLANYDRTTSSWRTSQVCLTGELAEFSETWPRSGMTRNGTAYRLAPWVPATSETACLSSLTKPMYYTPDANCWKGGRRLRQLSGHLSPLWVEWLMGYPIGWTVLEHWEMPLSRKSSRSSATQS